MVDRILLLDAGCAASSKVIQGTEAEVVGWLVCRLMLSSWRLSVREASLSTGFLKNSISE